METAKSRVLIVEEKPTGLKMFGKILSNKNFEVLSTSSVYEALSIIYQKEIDIVLLDIFAGSSDSFEFCQTLKVNENTKDIPVFFFSGDDEKKERISAYDSGGDDFFLKPFNPVQVFDKIKLRLLLKKEKEDCHTKHQDSNHKIKKISEDVDLMKLEIEKPKLKNKSLIVSNQKYLELEQIKNNFLKIICHELRTPVGAVIGFTEILKENLTSEDSMSILDSMTEASVKLKELTDAALMMTQIDPEKISESMRPAQISSIIEYAVSDIHDEICKKNIQVILPSANETSEVIIESGLVKEVIEIFLSNAVSNSLPNSTISFGITENNENIELFIEDHREIFINESFTKLKDFFTQDLTLQSTEWPGLRLAIAKFIMDIHNAEIKIETNRDGGLTAKLIFPINTAARNALHQLLSQLN